MLAHSGFLLGQPRRTPYHVETARHGHGLNCAPCAQVEQAQTFCSERFTSVVDQAGVMAS